MKKQKKSKKLSRGVKKYIAREKARIRAEFMEESRIKQEIDALYERLLNQLSK